MIKNVRHLGIVVSDIGRALHFYQDLLGFKIVNINNESGEYIDNLLSLPNTCVTTIKLSASDNETLIELLDFKSHNDYTAKERHIYSVGASHVAFTVDNLDALYHRLLEAGVRFNASPQLSPDGHVKVTFCYDPDGTPVELVEVLTKENP